MNKDHKPYDEVGQIMKYEQGELDEAETIELFQHLLDSGVIWSLQGSYQRTLQDLLDNGYVFNRSTLHDDGESTPSRPITYVRKGSTYEN